MVLKPKDTNKDNKNFLKTMDMKRYWSVISEKGVQNLRKVIPDGTNKQDAISKARKWIKDNGVKSAFLIGSSIRTDRILDMILIE